MREIKFRAWDKRHKQMSIVHTMSLNEDGSYFVKLSDLDGEYVENTDNAILMQFTGLHDKNGKEIFEGDVFLNGCFLRVFYCKEAAEFRLTLADNPKDDLNSWSLAKELNELDDYDVKRGRGNIYGNIYENPELLKEQHHERG